jgi:hypothetical protein
MLSTMVVLPLALPVMICTALSRVINTRRAICYQLIHYIECNQWGQHHIIHHLLVIVSDIHIISRRDATIGNTNYDFYYPVSTYKYQGFYLVSTYTLYRV